MRTLSPEMDRWLEQRMTRVDVAPAPSTATIPEPPKKGQPVPPCPLNELELRWLWPRYQACSFPPATAAKRLARTPFEHLTPRGRNFGVRMAYRFRRQVFGKRAAKWAQDEFLSEVRKAAISQNEPNS